MPSGSLTIVGTGIRLSQLSPEARGHIEAAEKLFYLVADPVTHFWLIRVRPEAESLHTCYGSDKLRQHSYDEMIERILAPVREGKKVCAVFYGHPGVFVYPGHEAIRRARMAGHQASMLPGISAEDCFFADLGIDPARSGCQSFEATSFLIFHPRFDSCVPLILWQVGAIGEPAYKTKCNVGGLEILVEFLIEHYGALHEVVIYEASIYLGIGPTILRSTLERLSQAAVTMSSTLYVPAKGSAVPDRVMMDRLKIPQDLLQWSSTAPYDNREVKPNQPGGSSRL
jgi:hypothetical protein